MQYKSNKKTELGAKGEEIACKYLTDKGYKILSRNWRFRHLEVDIIAMKDDMLHVVEVKTRQTNFFERPQDAVTKSKQAYLVQAINRYIEHIPDFTGEIQFDIITILTNAQGTEIEHIENAFYPLC